MVDLQDMILAEHNTLQDKMYKCKTIHIRYSMRHEHKEFLLRQSILGIYAAWEGFIKKSISFYLQEINRERLSFSSLHDNYISYQTDQIAMFKMPKTNFEAIVKLSKELYSMYQEIAIIRTNINLESNANLKVVNSILIKLRLSCLDDGYERPLNKLLRFRNSIAHGDEGIPITQADIDKFSILVQDLSSGLSVSVIDGYQKKVYLSQ